MTVVDRLHRESELPSDFGRDTLTLGWEERARVHGRRVSDGGVEFATSLPRGTVLRDGDCFVLGSERVIVTVRERAEAVFVIAPRNAHEWAIFAYHIGNRHQPVMITDCALVCPDAPGVEQLLQQHHMPFTRATVPFTPVAAAAAHHH
ncbi:MAG TPA: urease accessory protein UreE [Vicinamibacterales bacterium]|nr:urease accessory protein UreE [Vicinamibacterales bacterium]